MASITSDKLASVAERSKRETGALGEFRAFWRQFLVRAFDPYRPELHYMRGPGPACHAKRLQSPRPKSD